MIIAELARESDFIIAFRFPPGFVERSPGSRANACSGPGLIDVFRSVFGDLPVEVRARLAATLLRDPPEGSEIHQ
jgi:hypothetical protein